MEQWSISGYDSDGECDVSVVLAGRGRLEVRG